MNVAATLIKSNEIMLKKTCIAFLLASSGSVTLANLPASSVCGDVAIWDFSEPTLRTYGDSAAEIGPGEYAGDAAKEWWITQTPRSARAGWWPSIGGDHTTHNNQIDSKFLLVSTVDSEGDGKLIYSNLYTNLTIGREYTATVWLANTYKGYLTKVSVELPDGSGGYLAAPITSVQPPLTDNEATELPWTPVSITFTAKNNSQPIEIINRQNRGESGQGNNGDDVAIDDLSITYDCSTAPTPSAATPVPTLGVYGLTLLAGLIGSAAFFRRRKNN